MSILKNIIETASAGSTGATSIAGFRAPIGKQKRISKSKKKNKAKKSTLPNVFLSFGSFVREAQEQDFDTSEVISKLKNAAKASEERGEDTVGFGLEDEDGNTVKVWVPEDQADDFEDALETALDAMENDSNDDENDTSQMEIAEILWNLRKDFDIINVEWDSIPEDQEEAPVPGAGAGGEPAGGAPDALGGAETGETELGGEEGDLGAEGEMTADEGGLGGEAEAASALQQVIQAMKADAEARKAEAEAKAAAAKAEEAKYAAQMAANKVSQEEKILDMEAHNERKKEEKEEAKRLAQLAQYQHEISGEEGGGEEYGTPPEEPESEIPTEPEVPEQEELAYRNHGPYGGGTHISRADLGDLILAALRRR